MDFIFNDYALLALVGLACGFLSSLLGIGSGLIVVPALTGLFSMSMASAVVTSLLINFLQSARNVYLYQKKQLIEWDLAKIMIPLAVIFSFTSAQLAQLLGSLYMQYAFIVTNIVVILSPVVFGKLLKPWLRERKKFSALFFATLIGFLSGSSGIGGGGLFAVVFLLLSLCEEKKGPGTANSIVVFTSFAALAGYLLKAEGLVWGWPKVGDIYLDVAVLVMVGVYLGGHIGVYFNDFISVRVRKVSFVCLFGLILAKFVQVRV